MEKLRFTLPSHNGEDQIACYLELPEQPKAIFQILHGMCEYFERYRELIDHLLAAGYAVCGHDHVGHGKSAAVDERLGYFGKKEGHRVLAQDAHAVSVYVKDRLPQLKLFLLGHSMGSFVARDYITQYGDEIAGAVLMGTAGPNPALGAGLALAKMLRAVKGELHRSDLIQKLAFGGYTKRIENAVTSYEWLSRDMETVNRYADDKYCTFIFTVSGFVDMFTLLGRVNQKNWASQVPVRLPILLVAGEADPVGDYGKGVVWVGDRLREAGIKDLDLKLYPDMRHEILNEIGREAVREDLTAWLEQRV